LHRWKKPTLSFGKLPKPQITEKHLAGQPIELFFRLRIANGWLHDVGISQKYAVYKRPQGAFL
jgi:hypothetical protein